MEVVISLLSLTANPIYGIFGEFNNMSWRSDQRQTVQVTDIYEQNKQKD